MTFDDLRVFCTKHNIENSAQGIFFKDYTLYPDGDIWLNKRCYSTEGMSVYLIIAKDRTPRQMLKFIESLY